MNASRPATVLSLLAALAPSACNGPRSPETRSPETFSPETIVDTEPVSKQYDESFLRDLRALESSAAPTPPTADAKPTLRTVSVAAYQPGKATYQVTLDLSRQVLALDTPEDRDYGERESPVEAPLHASFAASGVRSGSFVPAAALAAKAKSFDDGLYAAVELAADRGAGSFPSRVAFLRKLLDELLGSPGDASERLDASALLAAAVQLGGETPTVPADVAKEAEALQAEFLSDERRSKPLGFYTWSEAFNAIFRRDRLLQSELAESVAAQLSEALSADDELGASYVAGLELAERITNPLVRADLRPAIASIRAGEKPTFERPVSFLPPSRAPETELVKKLYGDRPIPDGFDLADEMAKRIRAGDLDLSPSEESGWYDHQLWALEPLVALQRAPESRRLRPSEAYRKDLLGLFKALMALTRETHIKQLEVPAVGAAAPGEIDEIVLTVRPGLSIEPLPTYYLRRARSYRFVRGVLARAFGADGLAEARRLTAAGPVNLPLLEELRLVEGLFFGAYLVACEEIGMTPEEESDLGSGRGSRADRALLERWAAGINKDPDLGTDLRVMVPVFYDVERGKTKVWAVLGVAAKPLQVSFATSPEVKEVRDASGKTIDRQKVRVEYAGERHTLPYLVTAEVYVSNLLDRAEFRDHCDRFETQTAILANLE